MNIMVLSGRLTRDAVLRGSTASPVVVFTVAEHTRKKRPLFLDVVVFAPASEDAAKLRKGDFVVVTGLVEPNDYTDKNNVKHRSVQLKAHEVVPGLPPADRPKARGEVAR